MDLLGRLFIFFPMKENKKVTDVLTRNISEIAAIKLVMSWKKKLPKYCCMHCGTLRKPQINLVSLWGDLRRIYTTFILGAALQNFGTRANSFGHGPLDLHDRRHIYTAFILGKALQNFGPRANSFGHGPLDLHDKICSSFFNVDFWNGTPETRTALLNLCVPALIWQRFTCDFKRVSGMSAALLRAVRKKRKTLQILECKMQLYGSLLWKVKTSVTIVGWNKVIPCTAPYMH